MQNNLALILSSNQLGGAERSALLQVSLCDIDEVIVFVPKLKKTVSSFLLNEITNYNFKISYYDYPMSLYRISRENKVTVRDALTLLTLPISIALGVFWFIKKIKRKNIIYANGMKSAIWLYFLSRMTGFRGTFIWSFRDYFTGKFIKILNMISKLLPTVKIITVSNSKSVCDHVKKYFAIESIHDLYIYNPVKKVINFQNSENKRPKVIGLASMLTPWKGAHQVLMCFKLFEKEFENIGITQMNIYGKNIYQTNVLTRDFEEDLKKLVKKLKIKNIEFKGLRGPSEIYSEIDILIHPSLRAEPFGRIIAESFINGVPVISSGLGGARELIGDNERGLIFLNYDYQGLYNAIKNITEQTDLRENLTYNAFNFVEKMNENIIKELRGLIEKCN